MSSSATLLCVSEDLYALHEIVEALKVPGYRVTTACSYPRAVMLAAAEKIDIIVIAERSRRQTMGCPATLKFVRPELPILLLASATHDADEVPTGVDMVIRNIAEIPGAIQLLLAETVEFAREQS